MSAVSYSFLNHPPPRHIAVMILAALLFAALPLMFALPPLVTFWFIALMTIRGGLFYFQITKTPTVMLMLLAVLSTVLVWSQLGSVWGREGGIALLLLMIALKAFESSTRRDWNILLLATLFLVGSSVLLNQSLLIGLWLLTALFAVSMCFAVLSGLSVRDSGRWGGMSLLLTLPLTVVLFVSVPRLPEPLWQLPQNSDTQHQTGLSDTMQPGSISRLVQSNEWVANVVFADGETVEPKNLYWRAIIMDQFDGQRWHSAWQGSSYPTAETADNRQLSYQIMVRDQNGVLPALDYPTGPVPSEVNRHGGNVLRAQTSREGLRRLNLHANISGLQPARLSPMEYRYYTRLPEGNPQTRQLVQTLAQQSTDERDFIRRTLAYFRQENFRYTLQPPLLQGNEVVDDFIFRTRQGFCEHYAQSFAFIMRAAGLPTRIVTGYLGAEFNRQGEFWQIRSKDAHAWTEVWLPKEQVWFRVDPTAAVVGTRSEQGISQALPSSEQTLIGTGSWLSQWRDAGQFYFQQWVVNYDLSRQDNLFSKLGLGGFNLRTLLLFLPPAFLLAVLPLGYWWYRNRKPLTLQDGFLALKRAVLGADDATLLAVTPTEFRQLLHQHQIHDPELEQLLTQYEYWLYAGELPTTRIQTRWQRQIRKAAKRHYSGKPPA